MRLPLSIGLGLGLTLAAHGKARMIEDINRTPDPGSINLTWVESAGKRVLFSSYSPKTGQELWVAKPGSKPRLLKDLRPGPLDSYPSSPLALGDVVYFTADDGTHGEELWLSDGTARGTRMVADLTPGPAGTSPSPYHAGAGHLFFSTNSDFGRELWASDGSAVGTVKLNPTPGDPEGPPRFEDFWNLSSDAENAYFLASSNDDYSIWKSDGTLAGTRRLQTLDSGFDFITDMVPAGENLFLITYVSDETSDYQELWIVDKDGGAPVRLAPATGEAAWLFVSNPISLGDRLFFEANGDLWTSDGTSAGTAKLPMVHQGVARTQPRSILSWRGQLYMSATNEATGSELWKSDGTAAGTVLVKSGLSPLFGAGMLSLGTDGPFLCLEVQLAESGSMIWRTDGTTAGTTSLMSVVTGDISFGYYGGFAGNELFFLVRQDAGHERQLWRTDGTAAGTRLVPRKPHRATVSATLLGDPVSLGDGRVVFAPVVSADKSELWVSNGSAKGTRAIWVPPASPASMEPTAALGTEVILIRSSTEGRQLWITDGSGGGTRLLKDFTGNSESYPGEFLTVGDSTFFVLRTGDQRSLWRTDGTAAGTIELLDSEGNPLAPARNALVDFQGHLYFLAGAGTDSVRALWESDGTAAGTRMVREVIAPGITDKLQLLVRTGNRLNFFASSKGGYYHTLWTSDGTAAGTVPVEGINAEIYTAASLGDLLVYQVRETGLIQSWYRSDGTEEGTFRFADVSEVGALYHMDPIYKLHAVAGGFLFYVVMTHEGDEELWKSDGTTAGTVRLKDIRPGTQGSYPRELQSIGDMLYFNADDGVHGNELWQSDGTEAGTRLVADLQRGPLGSSPWHIAASGSKLYVQAKQQRFGWELHVIDLPKKR